MKETLEKKIVELNSAVVQLQSQLYNIHLKISEYTMLIREEEAREELNKSKGGR